ncbi:MAG: adenylate kinase [Planctomycetota bacterium]|nr:adenylate kinase [Planctomycetota bacterium]
MAAKRIVLFGAPGAGKGTQAQWLCDALDLAHLSTGDMLRAAVANKTGIGLKAKSFMEGGKLVPDDIVVGVVVEAIAHSAKTTPSGYALDGFPRTLPQAEALREMLAKRNENINLVVLINTPEQLILDRLTQRRSCSDPKCGAVYNLKSKPPRNEGVCDVCGNPVVQRTDDKPETIKTRLQAYRRETEPLVGYYKKACVLVDIPGDGSVYEVAGRILEAVAKLGH